MKDRILDYLNQFTRPCNDPLAIELQEELSLDPQTFQQNCSELRSEILHHYDQFSISTIDAFFQKVIRSFTREAGLMGDYRLEVDRDAVMTEVIDNLIDELGNNPELTRWVVQFARENLENDQAWDIRRNLLDFSAEIFREEFRAIEKNIRRDTSDPTFFERLRQELVKVKKSFQSKIAEPSSRILKTMQERGWEPDDLKHSGSGLIASLSAYSSGTKLGKLKVPGKRFREDFTIPRDWPKKGSLKFQEILAEAGNSLAALVNSIVDAFDNELKTALSAEVMLDNLYVFGLVTDLSRKLTEYKADNNLMLLADAPTFLDGIIQGSDTPFIYEKIGSFYRHYLIDEFQDTSGLQWKNFLPLLVNGLDQGYSSLIVGDVKQSIYRWRSGDLTLLQKQVENQIGLNRVEIKPLSQNFRSTKQVVSFNNTIFKFISARSPFPFVQDVYEDGQQTVSRTEQGFVRIQFLQGNEEQKWDEIALEHMVANIEMLQQTGASLRDIAILVRSNREGQKVADYLLQYNDSEKIKPGCRYDVVSDESLHLDRAAVVNLLLGALRYLLNTDDPIARAQVSFEYAKLHAPKKPLEEVFQVTNSMVFEEQLPEEFVTQKMSLKKLPLFELTETLIRILNIGAVRGELAYLQAFQDLVLEFYTRERNDLASFLTWWDENQNSEKTSIKVSVDTDAMQILTIHKAKGMQFKYVFIPFCSWNFDHFGNFAPRLWVQTHDGMLSHTGHVPVKYSKSLEDTVFAQDYTEEKTRAFLDNLNLLYVAFTRAKVGMIAMAPILKNGPANNLVARWVYDAILADPDLVSSWNHATLEFLVGKISGTKSDIKDLLPSDEMLTYPVGRWRDKLVIRQSGASFFNPESEGRMKINYGIHMHTVLSRIQYASDLKSKLDVLVNDGYLLPEERVELEARLTKLMEHPLVGTWFSNHWTVKTEVPILIPGGAENRIDRLLIMGDKAVVIDFKTGEKSKSDQLQVKEYMEIMKKMNFKEVEGYLLYLSDFDVVALHKEGSKVTKTKDDKQLGLFGG